MADAALLAAQKPRFRPGAVARALCCDKEKELSKLH
jgi:hypothetical protein